MYSTARADWTKEYLKLYNYFQIICNRNNLIHIIVYALFVLDRNRCNNWTVCELFRFNRNTWNHITVHITCIKIVTWSSNCLQMIITIYLSIYQILRISLSLYFSLSPYLSIYLSIYLILLISLSSSSPSPPLSIYLFSASLVTEAAAYGPWCNIQVNTNLSNTGFQGIQVLCICLCRLSVFTFLLLCRSQ